MKSNHILNQVYYSLFNAKTVLLNQVAAFVPNKKIMGFKNVSLNKACFIVCTGPSLKKEDLDLIYKSRIPSFSMNSIIKSFDETIYRPTYYVVQDPLVYTKIYKDILKFQSQLQTVFIGNTIKTRHPFLKKPEKTIWYNLNLLGHQNTNSKKIKFNFSLDCSKKIYDGFSVTYSVIQLAIYMGFSRIYLVGNDCNYSGEKTHFIPYSNLKFQVKGIEKNMIDSYIYLNNKLKGLNIKIFNSTRGGKLEVFPRIKLEDAIENERTN